jgi:hypothetical protein
MQRYLSVYLSLVTIATIPLMSSPPGWAGFQKAGFDIAQTVAQSKVKLKLSAEKKMSQINRPLAKSKS